MSPRPNKGWEKDIWKGLNCIVIPEDNMNITERIMTAGSIALII